MLIKTKTIALRQKLVCINTEGKAQNNILFQKRNILIKFFEDEIDKSTESWSIREIEEKVLKIYGGFGVKS